MTVGASDCGKGMCEGAGAAVDIVPARDRGRGMSCALTDLGATSAAAESWKISVVVTVCRLINRGSCDVSLFLATA